MKLLAVVKFNKEEAFVFDKKPEFINLKLNSNTIVSIAENGLFINCYGKQFDPCCKAFGGAKFELNLLNGEIEKCEGQWWDSTTKKAKEIIGETCHITYKDIDSLKSCYVYTGCYSKPELFKKIRNSYTDKVYEYREYEKILTGK